MNRHRIHSIAALSIMLLAASPVSGYMPPSRVQNILVSAPSRDMLRERLRAYADSTGVAPYDEGEAWRYLADSYWRAGDRDSARATALRAIERRGDTDERALLADILLETGTAADRARVLDVLQGEWSRLADGPEARRAPIAMRMAFAHQESGNGVAAADCVREDLAWLATSPAWALRLAPTIRALPARQHGWKVLVEAAVVTRGADSTLMHLAEQAVSHAAPESSGLVRQRLAADRWVEQAFAEARGGSLASTVAGSPLWRMPAIGSAKGRVLILLPGRIHSMVEADSLIDGLRSSGLDVLVLAGPRFLPRFSATSLEREPLETAAAGELRASLRALGDSPLPWVIISGEELALPAATLVRTHPRIAGFVLLSPWPPSVDRGPLAEAIRGSGLPVYLQGAPEAVLANEFTDRLAAQLPLRQIRVADGQARGIGVALLGRDAAALKRLLAWISDSALAPRATRPTRRR